MKPKITFRSIPYIDQDSGSTSPIWRDVEMLVNGRGWMLSRPVSSDRVSMEPAWIARSGITRAKTFPDEIQRDLGITAEALIKELDYLVGGYEFPVWVR